MASSLQITSGFFNAHIGDSGNYDRTYTVDSFSNLFNGVLTDGIFKNYRTALQVKSPLDNDPGMFIRVTPGKAWFNGIFCIIDSIISLDISSADSTKDRIDAVVLNINKNDASRYARIYIVEGTSDANPTKPTISSSGNNYNYPLAYVTIPHGSTNIVDSNIENNRGKADCPFVGAIDATVNMNTLYNKWDANWAAWLEDKEGNLNTRLTNINTWYAQAQSDMEADLKPIVLGRSGLGVNKWGEFTAESGTVEARIKAMGYKYRATITSGLTNVTEDMRPYITWDLYYIENCGANLLNQYCCVNQGIYVYADAVPNQTLYTVSIECRKAVT